ncbi:hypothetical protein OIE67_03170 [Nonomuraea fuscirosea]|uniref:hypothetical protein n=1 Tax=Nonomuraea fuscirosea TaxID=1291556 RepID=UPI002DDABD05|nr:hypothetical protein [Nonomuraea fuscirosea]WSA53655.1 hypothetical protein OIE67_03170 [Nonomuraea fuscirosea]
MTRADVRAQRFYQRIGSGLFTKVICRWQVTEPVPSASRESPQRGGDTVVATVEGARRFYDRNGWIDEGLFDHVATSAAGAIAVLKVLGGHADDPAEG